MALRAVTPHIEDVHNFLSHCHKKRYSKGTTTIYEGDECDTLYYIIDGSVSVILEDEDGKEVIISYLNAGDFRSTDYGFGQRKHRARRSGAGLVGGEQLPEFGTRLF